MKFISKTAQAFTSNVLSAGSISGCHTYQNIVVSQRGMLRMEFFTVISGQAVHFYVNNDVVSFNEGTIEFLVDGQHDHEMREGRLAMAKWLKACWLRVRDNFPVDTFTCAAHDDDSHGDVRARRYIKCGFTRDGEWLHYSK